MQHPYEKKNEEIFVRWPLDLKTGNPGIVMGRRAFFFFFFGKSGLILNGFNYFVSYQEDMVTDL